jgi:hypothetical protein
MTQKFELQTLEEYSDDAILAELPRVAGTLSGQRLTVERFNTMARVHSSTVQKRFGSWRSALDRAGIDEAIAPRPKVLTKAQVLAAIQAIAEEQPASDITLRVVAARLGVDRGNLARTCGTWANFLDESGIALAPLARRYTDEDCHENVLSLWTHYGRQPRFAELNRPPSIVGSKAYVRRWGGWRAALAAFVKRVNDTSIADVADASTSEVVALDARSESTSAAPVSRSISLSLRYRVLCRDRFRCVACGASPAKDLGVELHVDHIIPWSRGGLNVEENLRTLCFDCNLGKGARMDSSSMGQLSASD